MLAAELEGVRPRNLCTCTGAGVLRIHPEERGSAGTPPRLSVSPPLDLRPVKPGAPRPYCPSGGSNTGEGSGSRSSPSSGVGDSGRHHSRCLARLGYRSALERLSWAHSLQVEARSESNGNSRRMTGSQATSPGASGGDEGPPAESCRSVPGKWVGTEDLSIQTYRQRSGSLTPDHPERGPAGSQHARGTRRSHSPRDRRSGPRATLNRFLPLGKTGPR
jgi:hypothetical protein